MKVYPRITGALCANSHPGSYTGQDAYNDMLIVNEMESRLINRHNMIQEEIPMAYDGESVTNTYNTGRKYVLRRLTPLECLRLQGLPDWWVDGVDGSDSAVYKMAGNGLAIPCACDVLGRIAEELRKE